LTELGNIHTGCESSHPV